MSHNSVNRRAIKILNEAQGMGLWELSEVLWKNFIQVISVGACVAGILDSYPCEGYSQQEISAAIPQALI